MSRRDAIASEGPNAQQIAYWNEIAGPKWVTLEERYESQMAPFAELALDAARAAPGERVLDVGCGCGRTSLMLAQRVGERGAVLGVDISSAMLARARERARASGLRNLRFENVDAQIHDFGDERFQLAFSRFGVMFFADPVAAFTNVAGALEGDGRLVFVCWRDLRRNPWMLTPLLALSAVVELQPPPAADAPGPFSFADAERVRGILEKSGFREVRCEPLAGRLAVGGGLELEAAVDFLLQLGPTSAALREAPPDVAPRARAAVREAVSPHSTPDGVVMDYAAWRVTARV